MPHFTPYVLSTLLSAACVMLATVGLWECFVGGLYKQAEDPNLAGSLSGHKEGNDTCYSDV